MLRSLRGLSTVQEVLSGLAVPDVRGLLVGILHTGGPRRARGRDPVRAGARLRRRLAAALEGAGSEWDVPWLLGCAQLWKTRITQAGPGLRLGGSSLRSRRAHPGRPRGSEAAGGAQEEEGVR